MHVLFPFYVTYTHTRQFYRVGGPGSRNSLSFCTFKAFASFSMSPGMKSVGSECSRSTLLALPLPPTPPHAAQITAFVVLSAATQWIWDTTLSPFSASFWGAWAQEKEEVACRTGETHTVLYRVA